MPTKSFTTDSTCAVETLLMLAMAEPTFCTSLGVRCFMISDAAFSPTAISNMAARSTHRPTRSPSAIARHPNLHDLRDARGVLGREVLRRVDVLLVVIGARQLRILAAAHETLLLHDLRLDLAHHHARRRRLFDEILEER